MTKTDMELLAQIEETLGVKCTAKDDESIRKFIDKYYDELIEAYDYICGQPN